MDESVINKMRLMYPGAPEWLLRSEGLRQAFAEMALSMNRGNNVENADELAFAEFGYANSGEYWKDKLSEPMKPEIYVNLMSNHLGQKLPSDIEPSRSIMNALELGRDTGEQWVLEKETWWVDPLAAAQWMLSLPLRRHLVPATLASFLRGDVPHRLRPALTLVEHEPRKRGRRDVTLQRVVIAMKSLISEGIISKDELKNSTEKVLETKFGASRDTARKARNMVLSENVDNGISDNSSTNDK